MKYRQYNPPQIIQKTALIFIENARAVCYTVRKRGRLFMILNGVELYNVAETDPAMLRLPKRLFPALPPLGVGAAQNATGVPLPYS